MISLLKEKNWKYFARFFLILISLVILFWSLILTGLENMRDDKKTNNLRVFPIEYIKEMDNGEKILKVYKVPESKVGPENIKYPIKKFRDKLWINLSQTIKDKSEVYLLMADKRIFEAVELVKNKRNEDLIAKTIDEAFCNLKEAKKILIEEDKENIETIKINQQINQAGLAYEDIVKSLNCKNEKLNKIIDDIENWNQKNIED
jgi:hypothetical protein